MDIVCHGQHEISTHFIVDYPFTGVSGAAGMYAYTCTLTNCVAVSKDSACGR